MAAAKKLLGDIEAMLKKVDLGITEFDGLMENHRHASQPNQREKYEENMKASIKKLQRDRTQLSAWISDKSVKEKSALTEARSKIEARMEKHKTFERDVKKGLNNEERMDPDQEKRAECRAWIREFVNQLLQEVDEFTAAIEQLQKKKASKSSNDESQSAFNKKMQESHRWHVNKLEQLLRKVDNQDIDLESLDDLKDSLECYLDPEQNVRTPEAFANFDDTYSDYNLEEVQDYLAQRVPSHNEEREEKEEPKKEEIKQPKPEPAKHMSHMPKPAPTVSVHPVHKPVVEEKPEDASSSASAPAKTAAPKQIATKAATAAAAVMQSASPPPPVPSTPLPNHPPPPAQLPPAQAPAQAGLTPSPPNHLPSSHPKWYRASHSRSLSKSSPTPCFSRPGPSHRPLSPRPRLLCPRLLCRPCPTTTPARMSRPAFHRHRPHSRPRRLAQASLDPKNHQRSKPEPHPAKRLQLSRRMCLPQLSPPCRRCPPYPPYPLFQPCQLFRQFHLCPLLHQLRRHLMRTPEARPRQLHTMCHLSPKHRRRLMRS